MSSRGAVAVNGHVTTDEYTTSKMVHDAKVLTGNGGKHSLPDYAHSPNSKYIKENKDGTFRELRDYDGKGYPIIEIGYHVEPNLTGNRKDKVLHFHVFKEDLDRAMCGKLSSTEHAGIYKKYKKYLEGYGL